MSKRVLVFGGSGMLGERVVKALWAKGDAVGRPLHTACRIHEFGDVEGIVHSFEPNVIINCAGAISRPDTRRNLDMIRANALGPQVIALVASQGKIPVIHISTDCVFSGVPDAKIPGRRYTVEDLPDAQDVYGRSKALGEVQAPHVTNVRTSFIGPEHGLWAWLVSQEGHTVEGWDNAFWTGSTAYAVAEAIAEMAANPPGGTVHLATENKVSKRYVLELLKEHLALDVHIAGVREPRIDRALEPTIVLPPLEDTLARFAEAVRS